MEDDLQQIRATAAARSSKDFEAALVRAVGCCTVGAPHQAGAEPGAPQANLTSSVDALSQGLEAQKEARKVVLRCCSASNALRCQQLGQAGSERPYRGKAPTGPCCAWSTGACLRRRRGSWSSRTGSGTWPSGARQGSSSRACTRRRRASPSAWRTPWTRLPSRRCACCAAPPPPLPNVPADMPAWKSSHHRGQRPGSGIARPAARCCMREPGLPCGQVQESLRRIEARRKLGKSPEELAFRRNIAIIYALTSVVLFSGLLHGQRLCSSVVAQAAHCSSLTVDVCRAGKRQAWPGVAARAVRGLWRGLRGQQLADAADQAEEKGGQALTTTCTPRLCTCCSCVLTSPCRAVAVSQVLQLMSAGLAAGHRSCTQLVPVHWVPSLRSQPERRAAQQPSTVGGRRSQAHRPHGKQTAAAGSDTGCLMTGLHARLVVSSCAGRRLHAQLCRGRPPPPDDAVLTWQAREVDSSHVPMR